MHKKDVNELESLTKKLIKFRTVTGNRIEIERSFNFIKKYLNGLEIKQYEKNGHLSLVVSNVDLKTNKFDFILHGHIDIVPSDNIDDYNPKVIEEKIYGRGALDIKGGLACFIYLIKNYFFKKKSRPKILLLITSDEEIGGRNGTEFLLKNNGFKGKIFITAEGERNYLLKIRQKGVIFLRLKSKGKAEHSAYTWKGINAIKILFNAFLDIEKLFPSNTKDKNNWYSTINLGKVSGGTVPNAIPAQAEAEIDIRFCEPWKSTLDVINVVKKVLLKHKNVKIEVIYQTEMMTTNINNKYIQNLNQTAKEFLNLEKDLYFNNHGTNDARFASEVGIPSVGFGPIGNNYHANNEYISIKSLDEYFKIIDSFLSHF